MVNKGQELNPNNKGVSTRIEPHTGKGSTLDLGIISLTIKDLIIKFSVDIGRDWSPLALTTIPGRSFETRFSNHLGIKIERKILKRRRVKG